MSMSQVVQCWRFEGPVFFICRIPSMFKIVLQYIFMISVIQFRDFFEFIFELYVVLSLWKRLLFSNTPEVFMNRHYFLLRIVLHGWFMHCLPRRRGQNLYFDPYKNLTQKATKGSALSVLGTIQNVTCVMI